MEEEKIKGNIESSFRKIARGDKNLKNVYLLVYSEMADIHLNLAEGSTGDVVANPAQPNYMASVGKLFTSTLVSILYEKGMISFDDKISGYLDSELMKDLHVYRGWDYSPELNVRHLLKQTSGLYDCFWPLLDKLLKNPELEMSPRDAINWGKENKTPYSPPGEKMKYTDTNYYLLGLIIEEITGKAFHDALKQYIFEPVGMKYAYMLHSSEPAEKPGYPMADFFAGTINVAEIKNYAGIDYAGGGVVGPLEDFLLFMKALVNHKIIGKDTLEIMLNDTASFMVFNEYGYGIMKFKKIPLLMPAKYQCWGHAGATGAFMFYHPLTKSYIIGNFNDSAYTQKGVRFMLTKVIKQLLKHPACKELKDKDGR